MLYECGRHGPTRPRRWLNFRAPRLKPNQKVQNGSRSPLSARPRLPGAKQPVISLSPHRFEDKAHAKLVIERGKSAGKR